MTKVNCLLENLSLKSSKIIEDQLYLDKLNSTIKQLNILQENRYGLSKNFEITTQVIKNTIQISVQTKNILIDDIDKCYHILCCIRYEKARANFQNAFIWQNYLEHFYATKASTQQVIQIDALKFIEFKMFPTQLRIFLIFNIQKFLRSNNFLLKNKNILFDDDIIDKIEDFCVPIYDANFTLSDFLRPLNFSAINPEPTVNILMNLLLKKNFLEENYKLNNLWTHLEVEGSFKDLKGNQL